MKRITLLLVDDHMIVREGFRALLALDPGIEVVGEAENGRLAVELTKKLRPDVVLMDIGMPLMNGLEASRQILQKFPTTKVLMLSAHSDDEFIEQVTASGAAGYLIKGTSAEVLSRAIHKVVKGNRFFSPSISKRLSEDYQQLPKRAGLSKKRSARLTSREVEVLQLIAEGKANKQTAGELGISVKTVEKHRQHLMEKLHVHDTAGLTRYAMNTGIIERSLRLASLES